MIPVRLRGYTGVKATTLSGLSPANRGFRTYLLGVSRKRFYCDQQNDLRMICHMYKTLIVVASLCTLKGIEDTEYDSRFKDRPEVRVGSDCIGPNDR